MPNPLSPGIYIIEESTGARPIQAVGTSTAGFVGAAPQVDAALDTAVALNNWSEFLRTFGPQDGAAKPASGNALANAVYGFFLNGGSRCYVVNTRSTDLRKPLEVLGLVDEIAIIAAPGRIAPEDYEALISAADNAKDRVAVLDGPETAEADALVKGAAPAAGDAAGEGPAGKGKPRGAARPRASEGGYAAFYYPWLRVADALTGQEVSAPPSGHIAGIYARTDAERGVHKAPANATVRGAVNVTQQIARGDQDLLNPEGLNCLRVFTGEGVKVWGARTLSKNANWTYVNVRRLFNMIEESIAGSTRWVVFEPNDATLWKSIRRDVGAFLTLLWRQGALQGTKPEEAFFVKCDAETNTQDDIDAGRVVTVIGIAPVKPAEFVIFRIGQSAGATSVEAA
jgi:phage tail sheath protein FI